MKLRVSEAGEMPLQCGGIECQIWGIGRHSDCLVSSPRRSETPVISGGFVSRISAGTVGPISAKRPPASDTPGHPTSNIATG
jgi:hypothetical protein